MKGPEIIYSSLKTNRYEITGYKLIDTPENSVTIPGRSFRPLCTNSRMIYILFNDLD